MKIKTSELSGTALDWAVMSVIYPGIDTGQFWFDFVKANPHSTRWDLAGPILERENISVEKNSNGWWFASTKYNYDDEARFIQLAHTPLEAAMRCFVSSKLGDEVEIPDELTRKEQG
jgi:hypothetical protein